MKQLPPIPLDKVASSAPAVLRVGIYTGALLVIVMLGALVAANRVPALERYAAERNAISYGLFMLFMLIAVARFWSNPLEMFGSAMIGWALFAVAYDIAGMVFQNLFDSVQNTPLLTLCAGAVVYGVSSVLFWVGGMMLHARHHPIRPGRKATSETARHSR